MDLLIRLILTFLVGLLAKTHKGNQIKLGRFTIIPNMGAQIIKIPYIKWTLETHPKPIYNITKKLLTSYKLQNCHQFLKTSPTPKSHKNTQSTQ